MVQEWHTVPYREAMRRSTLPRRQLNPDSALRAAIYGRASSDPRKRGRSIKDQFADCDYECRTRNWSVVGYYEDRDRSASIRAKKVREDYERMVADVEAGKVDVIVYAERSRASRDLEVYAKLRKLCMTTGVLWCYGGRVYDLTKTADRRDTARDALQSEEEADAISDRALRTARLNAERGAPHGRMSFGFQREYDSLDGRFLGQTVHPEHGDVVRELFLRAARAEGLESILAMYRKYVPDATRAGLRYLLRNRAYLGVRTHLGVDMSKCTWPRIVEDDVFNAVQQILDDPSRRSHRDTRVQHELSGIARCSVCNDREGLRVTRHHGAERYICHAGGHVMARKDQVNALVESLLFKWLSSASAIKVFSPDADDQESVRVRSRLRKMSEQLARAREMAAEFSDDGEPLLSIESLAATERQLLPLIAVAEEKLKAMDAAQDPLLGKLIGRPVDEIEEAWDDELDLSQKRHVLRRTVNVELRPAARKGVRTFSPDRVGLIFAGEPGFASRPERGSRDWQPGAKSC